MRSYVDVDGLTVVMPVYVLGSPTGPPTTLEDDELDEEVELPPGRVGKAVVVGLMSVLV